MGSPLDPLFRPRSVAVIGASRQRGKIGWTILHNLIVHHYQGTIYPVNPKATNVHSIKAYPSVLDVPDDVDLAVITVPAELTLKVADECGRKGVKGLVVITAGFREIGGPGEERERKLVELCRKYGMTMIGPNCMGIMNTDPGVSLNASFSPQPPLEGSVSFLSQSGALGVAILDHARNINLGFAKFASLGNKAMVSGNDLLEYWADDPATKIILMYIENFGNPRNFVRIARTLSKQKPVIAVKSGRTEAGGRAAVSHTGALGGSDLAAEAAFGQTGVLRANSIEELFDYAMAFSHQRLPRGNRVAVITDAGGPAIMCTDTLVEVGMEIAPLSDATVAELKTFAPPEASLKNPVDLIASAGATEIGRALDVVLRDANVDAAIVIFVPPVVTEEVEVARAIWQTSAKYDKPVLCNFMSRSEESAGFIELVGNGIPSYLFPESAARALAAMYSYELYRERDEGEFRTFEVDRKGAAAILGKARAERHTVLLGSDGMELLRAYGFTVAESRSSKDIEGVHAAAREIGYPVVVKAVGKELVHKSDVGAIALDLRSGKEVREACGRIEAALAKAGVNGEGWLVQEFVREGKETILGMTQDKVFGPVLAFGLGGIYVEYMKDIAFGLAPVTDMDAVRMIHQVKTYPLLAGVRGEKPSDTEALAEAIQRLSQLVLDFPEIKEIDMNPLIALEQGKGCKVVDARVVL